MRGKKVNSRKTVVIKYLKHFKYRILFRMIELNTGFESSIQTSIIGS